jgi:hypothetical protein
MSTENRRIHPDHASPGMKVAEPVLDPSGQILIAVGEPLTERLIRRLVVRGVTEICILPEAPPKPIPQPSETGSDISPELPAEDLNEVFARRFHRFEGNEIMHLIRELAEKHLLSSNETCDAPQSPH